MTRSINERCSSTQISSIRVGTAAEMPGLTAHQAAELFVNYLIELIATIKHPE